MQGLSAYGLAKWRFAGGESYPRFEPLTVFGDETDEGHGRFTNPSCEKHDIVKAGFRSRVEDAIAIERRKALDFRRWKGFFEHGHQAYGDIVFECSVVVVARRPLPHQISIDGAKKHF